MEHFDIKTYLRELGESVNIESGTDDTEGVERVGKYFGDKFCTLKDFTVRKASLAKTKAASWEIFNKDDKEFDVFILCHIDTVFPRGSLEKIPYKVEGDKVTGAGSYDMKASVLSAFYAIKELHYAGKLENLSICVGLNAEEEIGSRNAREWIESVGKRSKYVMVAEPARANGNMVSFRKGLGRFSVEIKGKAVHAGVNPQDGLSAILLMADWIKEIHSLTDYERGITLNVGLITGGMGINTVPDYARIDIDLRLQEMDDLKLVEDKLQDLKKRTEAKGGVVTLGGGITRPVMKKTAQTEAFMKIVNSVKDELGLKFEFQGTGGGSDGNFTGNLGVPTLDGFGPIGGDSHTDHEYVVLSSIEPRLKLLMKTIEKIGEMKK